eukprot:GHRQ01017310.1.p2 GENE.GHRQ01017310.1~~GHRQ01017310.1.p2  ORF type:complete len:119 (+),score=8.39 GHRQ01017310.1:279-635(+)
MEPVGTECGSWLCFTAAKCVTGRCCWLAVLHMLLLPLLVRTTALACLMTEQPACEEIRWVWLRCIQAYVLCACASLSVKCTVIAGQVEVMLLAVMWGRSESVVRAGSVQMRQQPGFSF